MIEHLIRYLGEIYRKFSKCCLFHKKYLSFFAVRQLPRGGGVQIKVDRLGFVPYTESIHNILKFIHITVGKFSIHFADDRVRTFRFRFLA